MRIALCLRRFQILISSFFAIFPLISFTVVHTEALMYQVLKHLAQFFFSLAYAISTAPFGGSWKKEVGH
jgi:hypothetical protein